MTNRQALRVLRNIWRASPRTAVRFALRHMAIVLRLDRLVRPPPAMGEGLPTERDP